MSGEKGAGRELIAGEFLTRIRDAVLLRDWAQLEHWAKQWINLDPENPQGFKWLARASVALNKPRRAAYGYGRLLDFEIDNDEARKFFEEHPSALTEKPISLTKKAIGELPAAGGSLSPELRVGPEERQRLATAEIDLGALYEKALLHAEAAARYRKSFDWHPSQAAALGAARCLARSGRGHDALRFLRDQVGVYPDWIEGRMQLARIHLELGQRSDAQNEWQTVLRLDPANREALTFLKSLYGST